jgi:hypothetical protein
MSTIPIDIDTIVKYGNVVLGGFGVICGIVKWFEPKFSINGLINGFLAIGLCILLILIETTQTDFTHYIPFIKCSWGKGVLFLLAGSLFAESWGLWIACWVIFWLWGALSIGVEFIRPAAPGQPSSSHEGYETPDGGDSVGNEEYILK